MVNLGLQFNPPAQTIQGLLSNYIRVSQDYKPYSFFSTTKLGAFAVTHASEVPQSTVRVNLDDGWKHYKKVSRFLFNRRDCKIY